MAAVLLSALACALWLRSRACKEPAPLNDLSASEQARKLQEALERHDCQGHMGIGLGLADLMARPHHGRLSIAADSPEVTIEISLPDSAAPG